MSQINLFYNSYSINEMIKPYLYLKHVTLKGRGVFTKEKIDKNILIEESPVIVMSGEDRKLLDKTLLHNYIFEWGINKDKCCMALGLVPMYNHNYESNCEYFMDYEKEIIQVKTMRLIKKGEELTINYNGNWNDNKKIWFDAL
ncbi:MAG: SET domain-containing protein-lysine N-methyltransferase [Ginsengibacter sp.]